MALSHLHVRWESKRYERSRWMIVVALLGLAIQYVIQMEFGFLIAGCSRHHRAGPARRTGHLGQSARVTASLPTRKAALPSTHHGARTEPLSLFIPACEASVRILGVGCTGTPLKCLSVCVQVFKRHDASRINVRED